LLAVLLFVLPAGCGSGSTVDPRYGQLATRLIQPQRVSKVGCTNIHAPKATCTVQLQDGARYTCQEDITGFPTDVNGVCKKQ
jgi:hypothetical protein